MWIRVYIGCTLKIQIINIKTGQLGTSFTYFGGGEGAEKGPTLGDE